MTIDHLRLERESALREYLSKNILLLDGAMGTAIQNKNLCADDFGGTEFEGCNEHLIITKPNIIKDIHREYLLAGADVIETNTFGGAPFVLAEYGLYDYAYEINKNAAKIAREVCDELSTTTHIKFVAGSIGPTTKALTVTGGITFEEMVNQFYIQAKGLLDGGVDYFLIETAQDTRNIKSAVIAIEKIFKEVGYSIPIAISGTIEFTGTMLAGQTVEALYSSIEHLPLLYVGLNCATGPEFMTDHIRSLANISKFYVSCVPNAGLPDDKGQYLETPSMISKTLERFIEMKWINVLGGCCGTTPEHISYLSHMIKKHKPRQVNNISKTQLVLSNVDTVEASPENRPLIVGERTNVLGSKQFKKMISEESYELAAEIAKKQVKNGAHIVDIGLADPDRDELKDMKSFLTHVIQKVKAPLMIDSTDFLVVETALTYCQGKSIINSVNLEDGEEKFEKIVPLAKKYGAAIVVGCIDEDPIQSMAVTRQRKVEIAIRSYDILTKKHNFPEENIIFDPLVFPCGTGSKEYLASAIETIEGIKLIKTTFPNSYTILGISNISFGLPANGREVLNAVFLYHCTKAGLDMAIVNSEKLVRYPSIPEEERVLAENLLFNKGDDPVGAFSSYFKVSKRSSSSNKQDIPLLDRLKNYIIEGSKDGLKEDLDLARQVLSPLEIINGPLMNGMDTVGKLFNNNELIVAEVLQSAEAMKASVAHLEPYMKKEDSSKRGTLLLATVKGDVHDIGKNLVDIIFSNNGYKIINLGIKITPEKLIESYRLHKPDFIGLSGLLVKSAQQMVTTAQDLKQAGINIPLIVGGAALTRKFTEMNIAKNYDGVVIYAKDAMNGLDLIQKIQNKESLEILKKEIKERQLEWSELSINSTSQSFNNINVESKINLNIEIPKPSDFDRHIIRSVSLNEIWKYLNLNMLYGKHLGIRGNIYKLKEEKNERFLELEEIVESVKLSCTEKNFSEDAPFGIMQVDSIFQFFQVEKQGNDILLFDSFGNNIETFSFPRQNKEPFLSLSDFALPKKDGKRDNICLFITTASKGIRLWAERLKEDGHYLKSHIIQALALETAEASAEWLHKKIRAIWGIQDPIDSTIEDILHSRYTGKRFSFGYPACPDLSDQKKLFKLLKPEDIGVFLTDGDMMDPEASVSAIVFHHHESRYFAV